MNRAFFPPVRATIPGAALICLGTSASKAELVQSGVLECNVAPGVGFIIGSSKSVFCIFHRAHGRREYYTGTISRIGLDIGVSGTGQFAWGVVRVGPAGHGAYAGPGAGFALGAGGSANTLDSYRLRAGSALESVGRDRRPHHF